MKKASEGFLALFLASSAAGLLPECGRDDNLLDGHWVPMDPVAAARAMSACGKRSCRATDRLLHYEPRSCRLPQPAPVDPVGSLCRILEGRSIRFVGDSVAEQRFAFFANCWLGSASHNSSAQLAPSPHYLTRMVGELKQVGFSADTSQKTVDRLDKIDGWSVGAGWGVTKRGIHSSLTLPCGSRIDFRRVIRLPANRLELNATLHALIYLGSNPLSSADSVVLGFLGASTIKSTGATESNVIIGSSNHTNYTLLEQWWAQQQAVGRAPHLLWREPEMPSGPLLLNTTSLSSDLDGDGKLDTTALTKRCIALTEHGFKLRLWSQSFLCRLSEVIRPLQKGKAT